jgi:zinc D-Ala-D-Ala carboxypeptidase
MHLPPPPLDYDKSMPAFEEEEKLVTAGRDAFGREVKLTQAAAGAWLTMRHASNEEGVQLLLLSGFRSILRQSEIIQNKLAAGLQLDAILRVSAYPGFSEHHTGRAVDLGSSDCEHFSEAFETTREFAWLTRHASRFGFSLSYPRNNQHGIAYEPWHWTMKQH